MDLKGFVVGVLLAVVILGGVVSFGLWYYFTNARINTSQSTQTQKEDNKSLLDKIKTDVGKNSIFNKGEVINVLLIGIDRRNKSQNSFNTDVMILVSVNPETNRVLLTSIPRDLWINGNKINALYAVNGVDSLVDAFEKTTGQKIHGYIRADFEDVIWVVDAFGGVPIDVERTFTDSSFPNRSDTGIVTVTFTQGKEIMNGERALTFSRSRKGTNGEGSDLMRAKRQHLILQGLVGAISQPESQFWPMDVKTFYSAVTTPSKMMTTLTLDDVYYLWDFYKDKDAYQIESFVIGDEYIYHPGMYPESEYRAWVFIPRSGMLPNLHQDIKDKLNGTFETEIEQQDASGTTN